MTKSARLLEREPGLRALVEPAQRRAIEALEAHRLALAEQVETADGDPRLGAELFAARLHLQLDSDLSPSAIVEMAHERLTEIDQELRELAGDDVRAAFDEVARTAPDDSSIVPLARQAYAEATDAVLRSGIVTVPDELAEVIVMPEARRGVAVAYCDAPGPFESGGATFFAVSPTPTDWSADRVASFYREYNAAMVVNLTAHEAMPGHVLQLAHSNRWHGTTRVRQVFASGPFIEGWAVHAERIMVEAGHGGRPVRLQQLKMQLRTIVNALLDAGVHADGMTEAEAMGPDDESRLPRRGRSRRQVATGPSVVVSALDLLRRLHRTRADADRTQHVRRGAGARQPTAAASATAADRELTADFATVGSWTRARTRCRLTPPLSG